jgi:hypothetical protein
MRRPELLQRQAAQVRDDLLLGELSIAFDRFGSEAVRAAEPGAQMHSDGGCRRIDVDAVGDAGEELGSLGLRLGLCSREGGRAPLAGAECVGL